MNAAWRSRCTTCVAAGSKPIPSRAHTASSTAGGRWANVPTAPEILPTAASSSARASRTPWRRISSANTSSFRPNVVGSACTPWVRPMHGVCWNSRARRASTRRRRSTPAASIRARVADLERERGVEHVARGEPVVHVARVGADLLRERGRERDHVVAHALLDLGDARRIDRRLRADRRERRGRNQTAFRVHLADRELDLEPARVLPLLGEDLRPSRAASSARSSALRSTPVAGTP